MSNQRPAGVIVVGSANLDAVFTVDRMPEPGETLLADSAEHHPGGKGLNQAVASARAGSSTAFIGALGNDAAGDLLAAAMADAGIRGDLVRRTDEHTGQAFIVVDRTAENMIVVASGANATMTSLTEAETQAITSSTVLLMQLELPLPLVSQAARTAKAAGSTVMLNAAPATAVPDDVLGLVDVLIVNQHEACVLAGIDDLDRASLALATRVDRVIVTQGADGATVYQRGRLPSTVTPPMVTAIDTTGAGDTLCGAFAAAFAEGRDLIDAVTFATAAAALSVESVGAVTSIPSRARIDRMMEEHW